MKFDTREEELASSLVTRIKEKLEESLEDNDYTAIVQASEHILGTEDDEADELFDLIDDGTLNDVDITEDFDDFSEDFDDEDDEDDEEDEG